MLYYLIVCSYQSYKEEFNMNERLKQQLDFILEIDKEKNILRQTHLPDTEDVKTMRNMPGIWQLWHTC